MKEEFKVISKFIEEKSRVLDVGCGDGILMEFLSKNKVVDIRGLEISKEKVKKCLSKGLAVIEGDAENDLKQFPDLSFDYVILSQTLQAFMSPEKVIENSSRSTSYASYGLEMHDPTAGTSFIGVKSTGLNPEVAEYRKLKLAVEKLKSASIDKCTSAEVMRTP